MNWKGSHATPPPYLDCRAQDDADRLVLARFNLAVKQNVERRERAKRDVEAQRKARFGLDRTPRHTWA